MKLIFTICSNNYLAQAITLGDSLSKYNPDYKFIIGLVDRKSEMFDYNNLKYDIVEVEDLFIPTFNEMILRYDIVELNTSVKPFFFKHFFNRYNPEYIIYLDPDIQVFDSFLDLDKELLIHDIVITPHFTSPITDDKWQAEEDFLNSGLYNLGFIAVKNTANSIKMIDWWGDRLKTKAFIDFKRGLFTDQIWINFVPLFFKNVKIFDHPGYNVAYWNLHERRITRSDGRYTINGNHSLVFFHYASFRPLNPTNISTGQTRFSFKDRPDIEPLFNNYCELLFKNHYKELACFQCHYVSIKSRYDKERINKKRLEIPKYKRAIGKIVRFIIHKFDIVMDYSTL